MTAAGATSCGRVLVLGCSGAGKTTFATRLAALTGQPLVCLDREFWQPGWTMPQTATWRDKVRSLVAAPRWILEGTYTSTLDLRLPRADAVVWFDVRRPLCLWRAFRRSVRSYGRVRPDMAPGCPERFDLGFYRYIWTFNDVHKPQIARALATHGAHLEPSIVRNDRDAARLLACWPSPRQGCA